MKSVQGIPEIDGRLEAPGWGRKRPIPMEIERMVYFQ